MRGELVDDVLTRLGVERSAPDLTGLRSVYAAWCRSVPFDNTLKLIHASEARAGALPGSTAEGFFAGWLEQGTGGTCWAGNGALHDLLAALGFDVERGIATMMSSVEAQEPNHGSVIATIGDERWIADASILSGEPIRFEDPDDDGGSRPLPRFEWLGGKPSVRWRTLTLPDGFHCRVERIGADADEWDRRHQKTVAWSPFNYQLNVRLVRGGETIGVAQGQRYVIRPDGGVVASPLTAEERTRFLVEEIGIADEVAGRIPDDRPIPARPLA